MGWLVGSLLLSAAFCVVLCDDPDINVVKKIIDSSNQFFKDSQLTEVELGEFFITPVLFNQGRISQLDTLELQEDPEIVKTPEQDGVTYEFNLKIGMKKLIVKYHFEILLPFVNTKGTFSIDVGKNSFHVDSHVYVGNNGTCSAVLNDAYVSTMEDYEVKIDPKDVKIPFVRRFYEKILNGIVHKEISTVVSLNILGQKLDQKFKDNFNNIVCSVMTEAV
nr:uncharacterized protein LOC106684268 [Halyomorpha halys]